MTDSMAQELLRLEEPITDAVGLVRGLYLAINGIGDSYDRTALTAIVEALEGELDHIEKVWEEIQASAPGPLTPAERSA